MSEYLTLQNAMYAAVALLIAKRTGWLDRIFAMLKGVTTAPAGVTKSAPPTSVSIVTPGGIRGVESALGVLNERIETAARQEVIGDHATEAVKAAKAKVTLFVAPKS